MSSKSPKITVGTLHIETQFNTLANMIISRCIGTMGDRYNNATFRHFALGSARVVTNFYAIGSKYYMVAYYAVKH